MQHPGRPSSITGTMPAAPHASTDGGGPAGNDDDICGSLIACAQALSQVHALLLDEARSQRRLQMELLVLRASLARTNAALSGARDDAPRARHAAEHDALTLLANRHHFRDPLHQALNAQPGTPRELTVLYLDLDDFKPVNDQHGHAGGGRTAAHRRQLIDDPGDGCISGVQA